MADNDLQDMISAVKEGSEVFALLKTLYPLLPTMPNRDLIEAKIEAAEEAWRRVNATLAKEWGYNLCQCRMPPEIMLWHEREKLFRCQNPNCGRIIKDFNRPLPYSGPEYF